ncbi:RHS repeat-associated core domain-containing protein, partial [Nocardioides luteus]|uniref:RHS repeat-associated core domain-containing protein n=1 Tax=Nocardioides luteus TaxID=1844 RepID=UPI002737BEC6
GARYYDSVTGSFISPDPLLEPSEPRQLNAYAYGYQNPLTLSDPSGLRVDVAGGGGGGAPLVTSGPPISWGAYWRNVWGIGKSSKPPVRPSRPATISVPNHVAQKDAAAAARARSAAQAAARAEAAERAAIDAAIEHAAASRANARSAKRKTDRDDDGDSRPVIFMEPRNGSPWNPGEEAQIRQYVAGSNEALRDGLLSPTGRVATAGIADAKKRAVNREKARCPSCYPNGTHPGHVPDTTWTGKAEPPHWQALTARVNLSLGSQAGRYPIGYEPTSFWYYKDYIAFYGGLPGE